MNVPQEELDAIALHAETARRRVFDVYEVALRGGTRGELLAAVTETKAACGRISKTAQRLGAADPSGDWLKQQRERQADPLKQLALSDTPAQRRLLSLMIASTEAAAEVDREWGDDPADGIAAVFEHYAAEVQEKIHGAEQGSGRE